MNYFTEEQILKGHATQKRNREIERAKYLAEGKYELLSRKYRREVVLKEVNHTCEKCHNDKWLGNPIALEIHHKDNNNKNNKRENLEVLCLNCHYQTDNYRFRGREKT